MLRSISIVTCQISSTAQWAFTYSFTSWCFIVLEFEIMYTVKRVVSSHVMIDPNGCCIILLSRMSWSFDRNWHVPSSFIEPLLPPRVYLFLCQQSTWSEFRIRLSAFPRSLLLGRTTFNHAQHMCTLTVSKLNKYQILLNNRHSNHTAK